MPGRKPECTVIVPTYNRAGHLRRTLDSLVSQDIDVSRFEVVVVDDGSTDDTAALVQRYAHRLNLRYFYQPDEGFRVAAARNVGVAKAEADICVFVDSGVLPHSGALRAHLDGHTTDDRTVVVGYVYCFSHDNKDAEQMLESLDFDNVDGTIEALRAGSRWLDVRESFYAAHPGELDELAAPWLMFWTCNASARTSQLRAVDGFDEAFTSWGAEDIDLGYRLHRNGARFVLRRDACAIHYPHEKDRKRNNESAARNYRYMAEKHRSPVIDLLTDPTIFYFDINDIIQERGLLSP